MACTNVDGWLIGGTVGIEMGAFTPTAGVLYLMTIYNIRGGQAPTEPTVSTTNGLVFHKYAQSVSDPGDLQETLYYALKNSGLSNGTITVGMTGNVSQDAVACQIDAIDDAVTTGVDGADAMVQFKTATNSGAVTSLLATLDSSVTSGNHTYFCAGWRSSGADLTASPSGSYTEMADRHGSGYNHSTNFLEAGSTAGQSNVTGDTVNRGTVIIVEIAKAGGTTTVDLTVGDLSFTGVDLAILAKVVLDSLGMPFAGQDLTISGAEQVTLALLEMLFTGQSMSVVEETDVILGVGEFTLHGQDVFVVELDSGSLILGDITLTKTDNKITVHFTSTARGARFQALMRAIYEALP